MEGKSGKGIFEELLAVFCRNGVDLIVSEKLDGLVTTRALGVEDFYGFSD